jgi:hypothetical protein
MQYCKISSSCSSNWEDGGGSGKDTTDFDSEGSNVQKRSGKQMSNESDSSVVSKSRKRIDWSKHSNVNVASTAKEMKHVCTPFLRRVMQSDINRDTRLWCSGYSSLERKNHYV